MSIPTSTLEEIEPRGGQRARYRPELQGLRALAALLVVVYHVWLGRVSGGVDVLFLVSGFLITGQSVRASVRGGIVLRAFWARLIKRLLLPRLDGGGRTSRSVWSWPSCSSAHWPTRWLTGVNQPFAYFSLFTRLWEFASGGLLALVIASCF